MSVYIIAEAGVNHDGKLDRALELVDIAKGAGADCVKFQVFNAKTCKGSYQRILEPLELSRPAFRQIKTHCDDVGIDFLASCFDCDYVDFVVDLGCSVIKVGSGEITNFKLIHHIAKRGAKMILSTGASTLREVDWAVAPFANDEFTLLHCVSNYPTKMEHCNLRAIRTLQKTFGCPVGFSDHTDIFPFAAVAAVAMGAEMLEKHFTYNRGAVGPDHHMSASPNGLWNYVKTVKIAESMMGTGEKVPQPGEEAMRDIIRGRWDG